MSICKKEWLCCVCVCLCMCVHVNKLLALQTADQVRLI